MLIQAKILKNYKLNSLDGVIGKVKDFYFEDETWTIRYLIVNTGNWLTGRQVLISPKSIVSINKNEEYITIKLSKNQIENSPMLECDKPVSKQFQEEFYGYFGLPMYANGMQYGAAQGILPFSIIGTDRKSIENNARDENERDPHLRSTNTVNSYNIRAIDDDIGHVDDFIIDDETWKIQYMEIDTKNWLPGKKILISPNWIESVSWSESKVIVNLHCEEIELAPEYTKETLLDRDYETRLYKHYNREGYWLNRTRVKEASIT
ncbi:MAG: PRC-barrel domain-containing protein [Lachnotalea sp.]